MAMSPHCLAFGGGVLDQLNSIFFDSYLTNVHFKDFEFEPRINHINQNCILEFLFTKMDETNSARFRASLLGVKIPLLREMIPPTKEELAADPEAQPTQGQWSHLWVCGLGISGQS
jgi:hypothetical protein